MTAVTIIITIQAIAIAILCWSNLKIRRQIKKERVESFKYAMQQSKFCDLFARLVQALPTKENA